MSTEEAVLASLALVGSSPLSDASQACTRLESTMWLSKGPMAGYIADSPGDAGWSRTKSIVMSTEKAAMAGSALVVSSPLSDVSSACTRLGSTMWFSQGAKHCALPAPLLTRDRDTLPLHF